VLRDVAVPSGAKLRVVFASANRDGSQFPEPDRFVIDRDAQEVRRHLAFGFGPHACLGAALARTELRVAVGTLLRRLPDLALDPARAARRNETLLVNGFRELPVAWDPSKVQPRVPTTEGASEA
jgi:hypothetical protein